MLGRILNNLIGNRAKPISRSQLIKREAILGGTLFGKIPAGREREFFYLGNDTWAWNESWQDGRGRRLTQSIQYRIYPKHIEKIQNGRSLALNDMGEVRNLVLATRWYYHLIASRLYGRA